MDLQTREKLINKTASNMHKVWCEGELKAYHKRLVEALKSGKVLKEACEVACYKNGKKRNEAVLDGEWGSSINALEVLENFDDFIKFFESGEIVVKRFTKRNLTEEEKAVAGDNYNAQTGEENILRDFNQLSYASRVENLNGATGALNVLEEFLKRGYTIKELIDESLADEIGTLIHADWMSRNQETENNSYMFVPYAELDDWTKNQDLDVFYALLEVVQSGEYKLEVEVNPSLPSLNPAQIEQEVLSRFVEAENGI